MPWDGLPDAFDLVARAALRGLEKPPTRSPAAWAEECRILGSEESPHPGKWSNARTPYLVEPMECMALAHVAQYVSLLFSAQTAKTNGLLNFAGQCIAETPTTILWVLPSLEEARDFNRDKLEHLIANTPAVRNRVKALVSRDETGSTTRLKRFPGGMLELTGASSSKGLQSRTRRVIIKDEVSEFPDDVDGRGDPSTMADARAMAWGRRKKIVQASTPGLKGACRITAHFDDGSRGRYHVACPHCAHEQHLRFDNLRWPEARPDAAEYHCEGCGAGIAHRHKAAMVAAGRWVHERPELLGFHASFALNALYSPFVTWAECAAQSDAARDDPAKAKVFTQQWKGEAYEPRHDIPSHEVLYTRQEQRPLGRIPLEVLFLILAADVQGARIEWAVYGFDRHMGQHLVDLGICVGDTVQPEVWTEFAEVTKRDWPDTWGRRWKPFLAGVDSKFNAQPVYRWVRTQAHRQDPEVRALQGQPGWGKPPIGSPGVADVDFQGRKIGEVKIWPVGTWDVKTEVAGALRLTETGPDANGAWPRGAMRFPTGLSGDFFQQLTAEACNEVSTRNGFSRREWQKIRSRNEQWDLAVYSRALARHATAAFAEAEWNVLAAERGAPPQDAQGDLLAAPLVATSPPTPPPVPAEAAPPPPPAAGFFDGAESFWD